LLLRYLEPFTPPEPLHPVLAHRPAPPVEQGGDPTVAIPTILGGIGHNRLGERIFVSANRRDIPLHGSRLAGHLARPAFGYPETAL
jgi:hypothetical protein